MVAGRMSDCDRATKLERAGEMELRVRAGVAESMPAVGKNACGGSPMGGPCARGGE